jgi:hypothetical protein
LLAVLLLSGCGWNGTPTRHNDFAPLTSIKIVAAAPEIETSRTIAKLTSTKLKVIGDYSGAFTRDITDQATWVSASPAVADFIPGFPNRVKGLTVGSSILTATVGSLKADYTLTVSNETVTSANMVITPNNPSVHKGLTTQFTVVGTFSDNTTQDLTFDANWSPTTGTNAKVSNDLASKGLATALAEGAETITASFDNILPTLAASATTTLTVTPKLLQSITLTPSNSSIAGTSKTLQFTAIGSYSDGTTDATGITAAWSSSAIAFATIDATTGLATPVAVGKTSISATLLNADGVSIVGRTDLTVTALVLKIDGLQISPVNPTLSLGAATTLQLNLTATFADNSTQNVTSSASWTIPTASSIASVGATTGLVTATTTGTGTVTIQAAYLGQSVSTTVTITR